MVMINDMIIMIIAQYNSYGVLLFFLHVILNVFDVSLRNGNLYIPGTSSVFKRLYVGNNDEQSWH